VSKWTLKKSEFYVKKGVGGWKARKIYSEGGEVSHLEVKIECRTAGGF
jgi:hypothetical protein